MSTESCSSTSCTDCVDSTSSLSGNSCCWSNDNSYCYIWYEVTTPCTQEKTECPDYEAISTSTIIGIVIPIIFVILCIIFCIIVCQRNARNRRLAVLSSSSSAGNYQPAQIPQSVTQPVVIQPLNNNVVYAQQPVQSPVIIQSQQPLIIQQPQPQMIQPQMIQPQPVYQVANPPVVQQQQTPIYQNLNQSPNQEGTDAEQPPVTNY